MSADEGAPRQAGAGAGSRHARGPATGGSPALRLYLGVSRLAGPAAGWWLRRRAAAGREDRDRLGERLGRPGAARPEGRLVWLHGASAGEAVSLLPLAEALLRLAPVTCLLTAGTVAAARRLQGALPAGCIHQYAPVDTAAAVRGFLGHWRPGLAVWAESELWPRLMLETARRGVPMLLLNGRLSAQSARRWGRVPGMARALVGLFERIEAQDAANAARFVALGAESGRVRVAGTLKAAVAPPGCDDGALAEARAALGGRPAWLAVSTHAPEELIAAEAHRMAARALPGLLTLIAPRHPARGAGIAATLAGRGLKVARRGLGELPVVETDIWLADSMGEMGLWLRLAPVAFIGGSLADVGGHTPFEAAALGSAILHGPSTRHLTPAYAALGAARAACPVADAAGLAEAVARLLGAPEQRAAMAEAARAVRARLAPDVGALAREALAMMEPRG